MWSGVDAWELGLVDTLGGFETAFGLAKSLAGIDEDEPTSIVVLPQVAHRWYEGALEQLFRDEEDSSADGTLLAPVLRAWLTAARLHSGTLLALMPMSIQIR